MSSGIKHNNLYFNYCKSFFISVLLLILRELETAISLPENGSGRSESCKVCKRLKQGGYIHEY